MTRAVIPRRDRGVGLGAVLSCPLWITKMSSRPAPSPARSRMREGLKTPPFRKTVAATAPSTCISS